MPGREAAGAFLQGYLRSLPKETLPHDSGTPLDEATRDRLRALGYVN